MYVSMCYRDTWVKSHHHRQRVGLWSLMYGMCFKDVAPRTLSKTFLGGGAG